MNTERQKSILSYLKTVLGNKTHTKSNNPQKEILAGIKAKLSTLITLSIASAHEQHEIDAPTKDLELSSSYQSHEIAEPSKDLEPTSAFVSRKSEIAFPLSFGSGTTKRKTIIAPELVLSSSYTGYKNGIVKDLTGVSSVYVSSELDNQTKDLEFTSSYASAKL